MNKGKFWVLACAAIGLGLLLVAGGSFVTAQDQNMNGNANQNSNRNMNSNSGNMNSGNMNAGNMNRDDSGNTNDNSGGNMNSNMGGEMNANMSGNQNMNANMRDDQNMNANRNMNSNMGGMNSNMGNMNSNMGGDRMMALNSQDQKFMMMAAQGGMAEVAMARVALERASSEDVKRYAQKMIDDHTKANEELMSIAQAKGVALPSGPDAKQQAMMDKMMRLSGAEFDRQYMMMAGSKDHEKMAKLFQDEIRKGRDAEVKAFAAKTLPVVQEHLRMAQDMNRQMKMNMGGGNMNSNRNMNMNSNANGNSNN